MLLKYVWLSVYVLHTYSTAITLLTGPDSQLSCGLLKRLPPSANQQVL